MLDARDHLGGRTWWKWFAGTDHHAEMGGTWFDEGTQLDIAREIERYSLPTGQKARTAYFKVHDMGRPVTDHLVPRTANGQL